MRVRTLPFATAAAAIVVCVTLQMDVQVSAQPSGIEAHTAQHRAAPQRPPKETRKKSNPPAPLRCGDLLSFAVLMDREGFSPGQIDGTATPNFRRALNAVRAANNIAAAGAADCDTWQALGGDAAEPALTSYVVADEDVNGPYEPDIPEETPAQAALPALEYRSPLEKIAERFHASPALVRKLNPELTFAAGREIKVPAVQPFDAAAKPAAAAFGDDITIEVSRDESALRATRTDGTLVFFAPVTTGSQHDPLPQGQWKVTSVNWRPSFHYNPDLFWDAKPGDAKSTIKAGPNNPVGVVWIGLDLEHYGLHGTAEPGQVGRTASHGCVRLTNWDAARLVALVRPGTPVQFR
jgi:lipoprotein-anchoring transpeptidase ErfK/SrfK